ncbi:MAG: ABC transporter [Acidimicrobiales bacterium]|nr:ABC transporter [Acidimicrobiales bacterium]
MTRRTLLSGPSVGADLPQRLQALGRAVELADGRLDPDVIGYARHVLGKATDRLKFGTHHSVVALLGATGSGKSSMANAIIGSDLATTGVRRPTTSSTLACTWGDTDSGRLLDWLGIKNRHVVPATGDGLDGLVLLDVPDHDSVKVEHRLEMERIAEHADLLLFVTDPEKYGDAALHRYLRLLGEHGAVTAIVLNKADMLTNEELHACRTDLARLILADGVGDATILTASATTGLGVPELTELLADLVAQHELALTRLDADSRVAASDLAAEAGPPLATDVPDKIADHLAEELVGASSLDSVAEAVALGYRRDAAAVTGWPLTRWAGRLRPHPLKRLHLGRGSTGPTTTAAASPASTARVNAAVRNAADAATSELPEPWPTLVRDAALPHTAELQDAVDATIAASVRERSKDDPGWWKAIGALQGVVFVAMLVGVVWLVALAVAGFFALGDIPVPEIGPIPVPTALALGGALLGWLIAVIARRLARVGGARRAHKVNKEAAKSMVGVARTHVLDPIKAELATRQQLTDALADAGAQWPKGLR